MSPYVFVCPACLDIGGHLTGCSRAGNPPRFGLLRGEVDQTIEEALRKVALRTRVTSRAHLAMKESVRVRRAVERVFDELEEHADTIGTLELFLTRLERVASAAADVANPPTRGQLSRLTHELEYLRVLSPQKAPDHA